MNPLSSSLLDAAADVPVLVGFSGGLDSTVLLHLLAHAPGRAPGSLRAVHVHHGLQATADDWDAHCRRICAQWNIPLQVVPVEVPRDGGEGLEAAARKARHAAFERLVAPGEWLALGHHQDDQAETFLLRALRGSSVDGLAAMRERRDFGKGRLWRPLLHAPRSALERHARQHGLRWIEDPSNASDRFDRNFLRLQVLPLLAQRWPHAAAALARSAALAAEAEGLLAAQDRHELQTCQREDGSLSLARLRDLSAARRARVLRAWVVQQNLPPLPGNGVRTIEQQLLSARADAQACFAWQNVQIIRWREQLHLRRPATPWPAGWQMPWDGAAPLSLPDGGTLHLHGAPGFATPLTVRTRQGGERIRLPGRTHSHALKQLLQESTLPPWQRPYLPLLCTGDEVLAAGDRLISDTLQHWLEVNQATLRWQPAGGSN
jgi:tRNA(Ile)-lysidine synthase